jgi:hypothetical protein
VAVHYVVCMHIIILCAVYLHKEMAQHEWT